MRAISNTAVGLLSCETRKASKGCVGETVYAADATATSGERQLWCTAVQVQDSSHSHTVTHT
jgi:hypothetical protein